MIVSLSPKNTKKARPGDEIYYQKNNVLIKEIKGIYKNPYYK